MDLMVLDGYSLAYRAGHVLSLRTKEGKNTSVIFGLLNMIHSLLEEYLPKSVCICWDCQGSKIKEAMFPDYKIHRRAPDMDNPNEREKVLLAKEIKKQIDDLYKVIPVFGIKQLRMEGVEADDLIGLICDSLDGSILVVSSDKDILQVVKPYVSVYYPPKDVTLDILNFEAEMGLSPALWLDYRCLVGDISDGISGLKGFGDVTAKRILKAFGPWKGWWMESQFYGGDRIRAAVLDCCNKAQKQVLLSKESKGILERNFALMRLGYLVQDIRGQVLDDLNSQVVGFNEEAIRQYFEENQLTEYLTKYNIWIHAFRNLTRKR
jgi:DNA polymerase-1